MRLASLALFLGASALGAAQAIGADNTQDPEHENTYFNSQKVPPLLELTTDNFDKEIGLSKNVVVKFYRYVSYFKSFPSEDPPQPCFRCSRLENATTDS